MNPLVRVPLCASEFVTITLTAPAACAGVLAVMVVLLTTVTFVAAVPPRVTVAPFRKPVPVMVTAVPPVVSPELGEIDETLGAGFGTVKVNPPDKVPLWASVFVTTTSATPAVWTGVFAVIEVEPTTVTFVAADPPMLTDAPVKNPVPDIETEVPPAVLPELGEIEVTVGAGFK